MPGTLLLPAGYTPRLGVRDVEHAIKDIKDFFERELSTALNLTRVSAPLFVRAGSGVNDDLNGVEKPVSFPVADDPGCTAEIVQSLAKWKRLALARYGFLPGEGIYTDMNAVRPDESLDNLHSLYVDQWDWEAVITDADRTLGHLEHVVGRIYDVLGRTEFHVASRHSGIRPLLPERITFVTSEELERTWPKLTPRERENRICAEQRAVFVIGIGAPLADGQPHDGRAPDYDDWITERPDGGRGLNGDILVWHPVLERSFELSSMGIRVSPASLREQLRARGAEDRAALAFHRALLAGELPQTMGGGIGQSRLCMFFLRTAHIGEVSVGLWPAQMERQCQDAGIFLL